MPRTNPRDAPLPYVTRWRVRKANMAFAQGITPGQKRPFAGSGIKPAHKIYTRQIRMARPGKSRDYIGSRLATRGLPQH